MLLYHGSNTEVKQPDAKKRKFPKDFGWGFYCTQLEEQAVRWALKYEPNSVVNIFDYTEHGDLNIKHFQEMSEEWLDFIAACRAGNEHDYDIVIGPMADDTIFNYVQQFIDGTMSRKQFWTMAEFRYPTHQICFHTKKAIQALRFEGSYKVNEQ